MVDVADRLAYFQAITGVEDSDFCKEILAAHGWDLELAISSFTTDLDRPGPGTSVAAAASAGVEDDGVVPHSSVESQQVLNRPEQVGNTAAGPGLAWKLITLPISVVSGSLGLVSNAIGFGLWVAGGVLSYSLGIIGFGSGSIRNVDSSARLISGSAAASEAMSFVAAFQQNYGANHPNFVHDGFMDALHRSRNEFRLLFVYLHSPDHPDTPFFCERTLCSDILTAFVNENFVSWGGNIRSSEGFKMSNSLKASRFPFCAVVMAATNQRIALLQQVEGTKSPEEMLGILQKVLEDSAPVLVSARSDAEERRTNLRLREEQDAAYRAALEADQARERQRREEQERQEREAAEYERRKKEEEEACKRAALEAAEKEAAIARLRQEKAMLLGAEPEKGTDITHVLIRFPTGERKERWFYSTSTIQCIYDYVDSLGCLEVENYGLVSNFPRVIYGPEKYSISLKEAGLHPQASLFIELNS